MRVLIIAEENESPDLVATIIRRVMYVGGANVTTDRNITLEGDDSYQPLKGLEVTIGKDVKV